MRKLQGPQRESKTYTIPGDQSAMSCSQDHMADLARPLTKAVIVLTKNDLYKIRTGRVRTIHFHGNNLEKGRITFFLSDEKNKITQDSKIGKAASQFGDVSSVTISKIENKAIAGGKSLTNTIPTIPPVELIILSSETYQKLITEKNKKEEPQA